MKKNFYKVYARQAAGREANTNFNAIIYAGTGVLATNLIGAAPLHEGEASAETIVTDFALVGESSAGGLAEIAAGAFIKGEKGDSQALAGGENPVISEKALAELISFNVNEASWSTAEAAGTFGAMPLRQRLATIVTNKNVDLVFVDVRCIEHSSVATIPNIFLWDVPFYVGLESVAGEPMKHPCSVEKEVSQLEGNLDVYNCVISAA